MYDTTRTAASAAPPSVPARPDGPLDLRARAAHLRQAMLQASHPPRQAGLDPLTWALSSPAQRAQLLRHQHVRQLLPQRGAWGLQLRASVPPGTTAPARLAPPGLSFAALAAVPVDHAAPAAPSQASSTAVAPGATPRSAAEASALARITAQFQARFTACAKDPAAFQALLRQAFGDHIDAGQAEHLRQQCLAGDLTWMPSIQLADAAQMRDLSGTQGEGVAQGCYLRSEDTVLISRELLTQDPSAAERILAEELGHALDARLNTVDAAGDEGDIFSRLVHGEALSATELAEMKADNDHGLIEIHGRKQEVEYGWFKKLRQALSGGLKKVFKAVTQGLRDSLKAALTVAQGLVTFNFSQVRQGLQDGIDAVKDAAREVAKAVKDTAKAVGRIVKESVVKLLQSKIFNAILMVARFIPIPIVALVVQVVDVVKAAYMVAQGIKAKSWGAVLSGVATLAGGASSVAGSLGASASTVATLKTVADTARTASQVYRAAASKNFAQAALIGAQAFGAPKSVIDGLKTAQQVQTVVQAARSGHVIEAAQAGVASFGQGQAWTAEAEATLQTARQVETVVRAVRAKDYATAAEAGERLLARTGSPVAWPEGLSDLAQTAGQVHALVQAVEDGRHQEAAALATTLARPFAPQLQALGARLGLVEVEDKAPPSRTPPSAAQPQAAQPPLAEPPSAAPAAALTDDPKAALRELERADRQASDEGATHVNVRQDDRGLYGTALRAAGGQAQEALALMGLWKQDGLSFNAQGHPVVQPGQTLRYADVSQFPPDQRQALQREGAQMLRTPARPQPEATPSAPDAPAWSFKEASRAQRQADDARAAEAARQGAGVPEASSPERSTYDKLSTAAHVSLAGLGMIPVVGAVADIADAALTAAERPFGKSSNADLGLSMAAIGASLVPGADQAADAAKIAARVANIGPVFKTTKEAATAAETLGFKRIPGTVNGQAVFQDGKRFISRDVDGHNGGAWKMADSVKDLGSKETRRGTYSADLKTRIGD